MQNNFLEPINVSEINSLDSWLERFELWCQTNSNVTAINKTAFYLTMLGKDAYQLVKDLAFPLTPDKCAYNDLHKILTNHLKPSTNELAETSIFYSMTRSQNETFASFLLRLQKQAAKCSFGDQLKIQMRNRLVSGINHPDLQKKLLSETKLTFESAKRIVEAAHNVENALSTTIMQADTSIKTNHDEILLTRRPLARPQKFQVQSNSSFNKSEAFSANKLKPCFSCGRLHLRSQCKLRNANCYNCGLKGHIANVCKKKNFKNNKKVQFISNDKEDQTSIRENTNNTVLSIETMQSEYLYKSLNFGGKRIDFIIDTGSPLSIISKTTLYNIQPNPYISGEKKVLKGFSGDTFNTLGHVILQAKDINIKFHVVSQGPDIIGLDNIKKLSIDFSHMINYCNKIDPISMLVKKISNNQGGIKIDPLEIKCDAEPKFFRARPIAYGLLEAVKKNLKDLCNEGILVPVTSSTWATPIVVVMKSNGNVRICGDYRITINSVLEQVANTTREPEDIFGQLQDNKVFTKLDLSNAFLQLPINDKAQELTTIITPIGLFRYNFLPFGLNISPGLFQITINKILYGLENVIAYQDDILVYGSNPSDHDEKLLKVLRRLDQYNVRINAKKSVLRQPSISYLGYKLSSQGISPDPNRVKVLHEAKSPSNTKELRSALGGLQYYSRFIPNFSTIAEPLFSLQTAEHFIWKQEHEKAFREILHKVTSSPTLKCYKFLDPVTIIVDASETGIGGVLEQHKHPVICVSRRLTQSEKKYSQTQKEALAIVWVVKRLHKFIFNKKFTLISDHRALQFIFHPEQSLSKCSSAMLSRWAIALSAYNFDIAYKPGSSIPQADFLSRYSSFENVKEKHKSFFITPLPINKNKLILETRLAYGALISSLKRGWSQRTKLKFPKLYKRREDLSLTPDGIILVGDATLIPPLLRKEVLQYLHSSHLGTEKMKSLARMTCFWPDLTNDIIRTVKECKSCFLKPSNTNQCNPWPSSIEPLQRIHCDYCGPFLKKYYALIIIDSFSKFPEVFLSTSASGEFTQRAFQKYFSREGIPQYVVSDNGTHFKSKELQQWMKSVGSHFVYTAPRHPQSNGLAENFVRTLKTAIKANNPQTFFELDKCVDNLLFQYRNAKHFTTGKTPAFLFKGRDLRTSLHFPTTEVYFKKGNDMILSEGLIVKNIGKVMFDIVDMNDGSVHRRHRDQIKISEHDLIRSVGSQSSVGSHSSNNIEEISYDDFHPNPQLTSTPKKADPNCVSGNHRLNRMRKPPDRLVYNHP